jgi:hypothetical protein
MFNSILVRILGTALHQSSTAFDVTEIEAAFLNKSWKDLLTETNAFFPLCTPFVAETRKFRGTVFNGH